MEGYMIKRLLLIFAFSIGFQPLKAGFFSVKDFGRDELAAFYDYPVPSAMIMTTTTLAGTLVLYEAANYWKKHKKEAELASPWAMISPALIIGYVCVKIFHHGLLSINSVTVIKEYLKTLDDVIQPYDSTLSRLAQIVKECENLPAFKASYPL